MKRRNFLKAGATGAVVGALQPASASSLPVTPAEIEGPFYPVVAQQDKDLDLTQIEGHAAKAKGRHIEIHGQVIDTDGLPVQGVTVDIWQANAAGRYQHPHDSNPAPLDPDFQGWGIVQTGVDGRFKFKTVYPGAYPASRGWSRPPHIHFKVSKLGYEELVTQMYFPDQPLNADDLLLQRKPKAQQQQMIAKATNLDDQYSWNIVIQKILN